MKLPAPAKINWFLEITGKRPDGYHTLSTVFQTISLSDALTFKKGNGLTMSCSNRSLSVDSSNLVWRAADLIQTEIRQAPSLHIHLDKKVPMGAGLGGGSSDAAVALAGTLKWNRRSLPLKKLAKLAVSLGADVPFFLEQGTCLATGIGEKLKPLTPLPTIWLVLVYPGFGVSTPEAYRRVRLPFESTRSVSFLLKAFKKNPKSLEWTQFLFNRFEDLVFPHYPALPVLKHELVSAGSVAALMSGSGSTVFGVVRSESEGKRVLSRMKKKYPLSWLVHTL